MALAACYECGSLISEDANKCPKCGRLRPTRESELRARKLPVLIYALVIFAIFLLDGSAYTYFRIAAGNRWRDVLLYGNYTFAIAIISILATPFLLWSIASSYLDYRKRKGRVG